MAKQQRMFIITLAALYCGLTPRAWQPRWGQLGAGVMAAALALIIAGCVATVIRRLVRIYRQLERNP